MPRVGLQLSDEVCCTGALHTALSCEAMHWRVVNVARGGAHPAFLAPRLLFGPPPLPILQRRDCCCAAHLSALPAAPSATTTSGTAAAGVPCLG